MLRWAAAYLFRANLPGNDVPLVRKLTADGTFVAVTCRALKIAGQAHRGLANSVTDAKFTAAYRADALQDAHRDDPSSTTGLSSTTPRRRGANCGTKRLADLLRLRRAVGTRQEVRQERKDAWPAGPRRPLRRGPRQGTGPPEFAAASPDELWLADITEHRTRGRLALHPSRQGPALGGRRAHRPARGVDATRECFEIGQTEATKRARRRAYEQTELGRIQAGERLMKQYFDRVFAERRSTYDELFERLDRVMDEGNGEAVHAVLRGIVDVPKTSPIAQMGDLGQIRKAPDDPDTEWEL